MELVLRSLGALVVTYVMSRIVLGLLKGRVRFSAAVLVAIHLFCFGAVAFVLGLMRAYLTWFEWNAAAVYAVPQAAWLLLDLARLRR
ncbi:hypothetical protein OF829_14735 [Sphingomonas sp. LB-2]|uniref:hypothetical protein n=1 Tax=Sphingomonas caeni TaxID=2984949 RepID=UPI00223233D7|nr:hypothetical protein [Sphingomonas caeni]MCW3848495.1 hypothetical protein [Sphingomonas caeni]